MKNLAFLPFAALTFCCWGLYGPTIHSGQEAMGDFENTGQLSTLRPLICVGLAYFLVAVMFPLVVLLKRGEQGSWTSDGVFWSFVAGVIGACGALGIILAFKFRGSPVYVMPLVFGCAPVVNIFVTMLMTKSLHRASPTFFLGVLVVAIGASGVLIFQPSPRSSAGELIAEWYKSIEVSEAPDGSMEVAVVDREGQATTWNFTDRQALMSNNEVSAIYEFERARKRRPTLGHALMIAFSIALTASCWGVDGALLHRGQMKMAGSRLRPFICVGLAYFLVAVVVSVTLLPAFPPEPGGWHASGIAWSLLGGIAGACGALSIVYAFNSGGKPILVMPLVFGGAAVVNTIAVLRTHSPSTQAATVFFLSLFLLICGAVTVLVFAPAPLQAPQAAEPSSPGDGVSEGAKRVPDQPVGVPSATTPKSTPP